MLALTLAASLSLGIDANTAVARATTIDDTLQNAQEIARQTAASGDLLAQKKKAKKKKKSNEDLDNDFGPGDVEAISREDSDTGAGIHRAHEGIDRPYLIEASGLTSYSSLTTTVGSGDPTTASVIDIGGELLFILGRIEVGPALSYVSSTSKATVSSTDPTTQVTTSTSVDVASNDLLFGGVFKFNFADLDTATLVPFAYAGVAYLMGEEKSGSSDSTKTTGSAIRLGGGANFFLDSNISFQPRLEYLMQSEKGDGEGAEEIKTSGIKLLLGLGTFL
ncbi:MAG TPA: hypothetical protein VGD87_06950 [Archangium sp.]